MILLYQTQRLNATPMTNTTGSTVLYALPTTSPLPARPVACRGDGAAVVVVMLALRDRDPWRVITRDWRTSTSTDLGELLPDPRSPWISRFTGLDRLARFVPRAPGGRSFTHRLSGDAVVAVLAAWWL